MDIIPVPVRYGIATGTVQKFKLKFKLYLNLHQRSRLRSPVNGLRTTSPKLLRENERSLSSRYPVLRCSGTHLFGAWPYVRLRTVHVGRWYLVCVVSTFHELYWFKGIAHGWSELVHRALNWKLWAQEQPHG